MMIINFIDGEDDATLECQFCGSVDLPMEIRLQGNATEPTGESIIREHSRQPIPALSDDTDPTPACENWSKWKTTTWEIRDQGIVVQSGNVTVRPNLEVLVTT